jgi:hypothetical protein
LEGRQDHGEHQEDDYRPDQEVDATTPGRGSVIQLAVRYLMPCEPSAETSAPSPKDPADKGYGDEHEESAEHGAEPEIQRECAPQAKRDCTQERMVPSHGGDTAFRTSDGIVRGRAHSLTTLTKVSVGTRPNRRSG